GLGGRGSFGAGARGSGAPAAPSSSRATAGRGRAGSGSGTTGSRTGALNPDVGSGGAGGGVGEAAVSDLLVASTFQSGGSGGGGGASQYSPTPPERYAPHGGAGGGGAGGAIRLVSLTRLEIGPAGAVLANGGAGGDVLVIREPTELADGTIDPAYQRRPGGAGGAGSGGVVFLATPILEVRGRVEAAGGLGGRGETGSRTASNFGGDGGVGRVRVSTRIARCVATGTFDPPLAGGRCLPSGGGAGVPAIVEWPD
ncbi:MAG: hypothetical protein AAF447_15700, partial [Myxococcota bacterium]